MQELTILALRTEREHTFSILFREYKQSSVICSHNLQLELLKITNISIRICYNIPTFISIVSNIYIYTVIQISFGRNGTPIYLQIIRYIQQGLAAGTIQDGDELPSRRVVSALLAVNPNTVL